MQWSQLKKRAESLFAGSVRGRVGLHGLPQPEHQEGDYAASDEAEANLRRTGVFARHDLHRSLFNYLNLSVEDILESADPIIRAVGMLDRRVGLRRLAAMEMGQEHPLVRTLHAFRCEAEGALRR